jgi:hypothetical protein
MSGLSSKARHLRDCSACSVEDRRRWGQRGVFARASPVLLIFSGFFIWYFLHGTI